MCGYVKKDRPDWAAFRFEDGTRVEAHGSREENDALRAAIGYRLVYTRRRTVDERLELTFETADGQQHTATFTFAEVTHDPYLADGGSEPKKKWRTPAGFGMMIPGIRGHLPS